MYTRSELNPWKADLSVPTTDLESTGEAETQYYFGKSDKKTINSILEV